jgi:hypothetical protein
MVAPSTPFRSTCKHVKPDGERCKHFVREGEGLCWQHAKSWRNKYRSLTKNQTLIFGIAVASLVFTFGLWGYDKLVAAQNKKVEEQADVARSIKPRIELPKSGNLWLTSFTVTNNSAMRLINTEISCRPRFIGDVGGNSFTNGQWHTMPPMTVEPGGDVAFTQCLSVISDTGHEIICADVDLNFHYTLQVQPTVLKDAKFRYVGYREMGVFTWRQMSENFEGTYCHK